mgnify:CR=1 FL=1|tara:strand:+ start:2069 stop:2377 length:309 start_codon:yes stop_codon:yes gene_type:complete
MPYTPEELQNLTWYQNLINQDEQQYLIRKERLMEMNAVSGSEYDGNLVFRKQDNTILLFENPYSNQLPEDPSTKVSYNTVVQTLKKDEGSVNDVIDRNFEEL